MIRSLKVPVAGVFVLAFAFSSLHDPRALGFEPMTANAHAGVRTVGCTVRRLEIGARRLDILVGVGHAFRIERLELSATCAASAQGRAIGVNAIHPGDIVRVELEPAAGRLAAPARGVVTRIDLVLPAPERGPR
jgi:hypothetical protein